VLDDQLLAYYRATINTSRLSIKSLVGEMPRRYWRNMPETTALPSMIAKAREETDAMVQLPPDEPPRFAAAIEARLVERKMPDLTSSLASIQAELTACRRCPLYANATQAVPGEGPSKARIVMVGEQPGDQEDLTGRPFVGPAGKVLDRALLEAGLDRDAVYLTNAVKHFKYEPRGKRRLHKRPNAGEITACRWWLSRELATIKPKIIVALGGTAAGALAGRPVSVVSERGQATFDEGSGFITVHPSFLLRIPDASDKVRQYALFVSDLRRVAELART
jgi:DNA polymerase